MDEKSAKLNRSNMTYVILHFWLFIGHLNIKLLPTKQMEEGRDIKQYPKGEARWLKQVEDKDTTSCQPRKDARGTLYAFYLTDFDTLLIRSFIRKRNKALNHLLFTIDC